MAQMSYGRAMAWLAAREPDAPAVVFEGTTRTRRELESRSNRLARSYEQAGVREGDRITIALPNSLEFFEVCLAAWKLGASPNPVSSRLPEMERRELVDLADPALVSGVPEGIYEKRVSRPAGFEPAATIPDTPLPDVVSQVARTLASGGSTGRPKLIVTREPALTDPELETNRARYAGCTLVPGPLYHAGPFMASWQAILAGSRVILMPRFDAEESLALIERHRVDWVLFVPTMMQRIWRLPNAVRNRYDVSSLRTVMSTGAPSPEWLKRAWIDWLGPEKIMEAYGGSERIAGTAISGTEWLLHPGSVGKPTAGRKIRILDEAGGECPSGVMGEVYMMPAEGPGSTYSYVGDDVRPNFDGWESLGDMGYVDEDGYLYLGDRKSDMIVTGGANVFPAEVEAAIDAHPTVRSSAVVGLPDDDLGQRIHAIIDAPSGVTQDELIAHLAERLVRYKIPRTLEFVDNPLRDDAGKVRRSALREERIQVTKNRGEE